MKIDLITFEDIRERAEIDIFGGIIEIPCADKVMRGTIDDILWWPHRHPREIHWVNGMAWNNHYSAWDHFNNGITKFKRESFDWFDGPYQMESGEIFFMLQKVIHVIIFPVGHPAPETPYDWRVCNHLHCGFMGIESPKRKPT